MNNYLIDSFVYLNKNSISTELCDDLIKLFEEETDGKYEGITASGLNKDIKDTTGFPNDPVLTDRFLKYLDQERAYRIASIIFSFTKYLYDKFIIQLNSFDCRSIRLTPRHLFESDRSPDLGTGTHWLLCQLS
jgi:hypothetical protein